MAHTPDDGQGTLVRLFSALSVYDFARHAAADGVLFSWHNTQGLQTLLSKPC